MNKIGRVKSWTMLLGATGIFTLGVLAMLVLMDNQPAQAENGRSGVSMVQALYPAQWRIKNPVGMAYSAGLNEFFFVDGMDASHATLTVATPYKEVVATATLPEAVADAVSFTFDDSASQLLFLNPELSELTAIKVSSTGTPGPAPATPMSIARVGLTSAQGMAVDAVGKFLFILDSAAGQLVRIELKEDLAQAQIEKFPLAPDLDTSNLRGLAVNPTNRHVYVVHPELQILDELNQSGQLVTQYDLSNLELTDAQMLLFATSRDLTDDPQITHLFIADRRDSQLALPYKLYLPLLPSTRGAATQANPETNSIRPRSQALLGQIVEVTLDPAEIAVQVASTDLTALTLVRTVNTAAWSPPSPDPSGITYLPDTDSLLISDAEVDEMPPYFTGANLYFSNRQGGLLSTKTTTAFSIEPTDVAYNSANGHLFFSDDDKKKVFEVNPGADGVLNTGDDIVTSFSTKAFSSMDCEGLDYDVGSGDLFIADGVNREVYRVDPGPNGRFDGVPASGGDDVVSQFDVADDGLGDPSGVDFDPFTGNVVLVDGNNHPRILYEVNVASGNLAQSYDISSVLGKRLDGVVMAPNSNDPSRMSYYIVDRRVDNNIDPSENDGKMYEFLAPGAPLPPTNTPTPTPTDTPSGPPPTPTDTPTPTNTPTASDLIFADGFESGNLSAWTSSATGGGDLSVSPDASLVGAFGLRAFINDTTALYVTDDSPAAEARYRARFYFDPNSISMVSGNDHFIFYGFQGTSTIVLRVPVHYSSQGAYQLRLALIDDSGTWWTTGSWFTITDAPHYIELDWQAATAPGANNGGVTFWIDGVQKASIATVDNDTRRIDRVRLGAVGGIDAGTNGTSYLDAFESRRQSYIGPATGTVAAAVEPSVSSPAGSSVWIKEEEVPEASSQHGLYIPLLSR